MWCDVLVESINLWLLQIDNVDCFSFIKTMCIIHVHKLLLFIVCYLSMLLGFFYCYRCCGKHRVVIRSQGNLESQVIEQIWLFSLCLFLYFYINSILTTCSIIIDDCLANMWLLWRKEIAWMKSTTLENSSRVDFGDKSPDTIEMP